MSLSSSKRWDIQQSEGTWDTPIRGLSRLSQHIQSGLSLKCPEIVPICPILSVPEIQGDLPNFTPFFGATA